MLVKKFIFKKRYLAAVLAGFMFLTGCAGQKGPESEKREVKTGTVSLTDIHTAEYWINRRGEDHTVLMTAAEISDYNKMIQQNIGKEASLYDLDSLAEGMERAQLQSWLESSEIPSEGPYYSGSRQLSDADWKRIEANKNLDHIPEEPKVRWGVCTERSSVRTFPTADAVTAQQDDRYDDTFQETAILLNEPAAILHTSADGKFYYVCIRNYRGWVLADAIGLCKNYDEWKQAVDAQSFLIVTGSRYLLNEDPYEPAVSNRELTMGTKFALAEKPGTVKSIRNRVSYDSYIIDFPVRNEDGSLSYKEVLVPVSADVSVGYLEYTEPAVLEQAFKMLGEVYGWGGMVDARDCSSLVMELYQCFGFELPRNGSGLAMLPGEDNADLKDLTVKEKEDLLGEAAPGSILYFPGHIMLYLGEAEGKFYCLSATGSFAPEGTSENEVRKVNSVVISSLDVIRKNGNTWMESLEKLIRL